MAFFLVDFVRAEEAGVNLFILSGQSNMSRLELKDEFIPAVEKEFGKKAVLVVKDAMPGQHIKRWYKLWTPVNGQTPAGNGDLYDRLITKVNAATKGVTVKTVTFIWMQGESDSQNAGVLYEPSLLGLFDQIKSDLKRTDINFVIGRISDYTERNKAFAQNWEMIRKTQVKVGESGPRFAWVDTDDLNDGVDDKGKEVKNDLHCSVEGRKIMGQRFAAKAIELIKRNAAGTLTDQAAWRTSTTVIEDDTASLFRVRDAMPLESNNRRFLRLRFTLQPSIPWL